MKMGVELKSPKILEVLRKHGGSAGMYEQQQLLKDQGNEHFKKSQYAEAIQACSKALQVDPKGSSNHVLYANQAQCHLELRHWEEAEKAATACIEISGTFFKAFYRRALARRALGDVLGARGDLETMLQLSPGNTAGQDELKAVSAEILKRERETPEK